MREQMSETPTQNEMVEAINGLKAEVEKLNKQRFFASQNKWLSLMFFNLVRGLLFGLGSVIGATLLVYVLVQLLAQIDFIPILGDWVQRIIDIIQSGRSGAS